MSVGTGIVGGRVVGVLTVTAGVGDIPADGVNVGVALQAEPKTNITKMDTIFRKGLDIFSSKQPAALIGGLTCVLADASLRSARLKREPLGVIAASYICHRRQE